MRECLTLPPAQLQRGVSLDGHAPQVSLPASPPPPPPPWKGRITPWCLAMTNPWGGEGERVVSKQHIPTKVSLPRAPPLSKLWNA